MHKIITSVILAVVLILTYVLLLVSIYRPEGNAHIINYTGIMRGASQRLVIHELNRVEDDGLIEKIDHIREEVFKAELRAGRKR